MKLSGGTKYLIRRLIATIVLHYVRKWLWAQPRPKAPAVTYRPATPNRLSRQELSALLKQSNGNLRKIELK